MKITLLIMLSSLLFCNSLFAEEESRTDLRLYRPFEAVAEQAIPKVDEVLQGNCTLPSQVDHRNDAWRCLVNNQQYDPCFVKTYVERQQLICPEAPWSSNAARIKVKDSLINSNDTELDMSQDFPWAVQLSDGTRCLRTKDPTLMIDSQPVRYTCQDKSYLVGRIQRCKRTWKTLHSTAYQQQQLSLADISIAWF